MLEALLPDTGDSVRIGISGSPGVGKSTFIEAFGLHVVDRGHRVAVLAVDPSSSRTGGSILGDKTRMAELSRHPDAFIRPVAGRAPSSGGVARRTREAMLLCEAAGFDVVIVETIGVGQSEVAVADMVDLFCCWSAPGGGDDLQGIKRGIMELADLVVVNKADGDLAAAAGRAPRPTTPTPCTCCGPRWRAWTARARPCSALEGTGVAEVWQARSRRSGRPPWARARTGQRRRAARPWPGCGPRCRTPCSTAAHRSRPWPPWSPRSRPTSPPAGSRPRRRPAGCSTSSAALEHHRRRPGHARRTSTRVRGAAFGLAFVIGSAALVLLRQPGFASWNTVWAEDGAVYASQALSRPALHTLVTPYAGYVQLTPRLLALPVRVLPVAWFALVRGGRGRGHRRAGTDRDPLGAGMDHQPRPALAAGPVAGGRPHHDLRDQRQRGQRQLAVGGRHLLGGRLASCGARPRRRCGWRWWCWPR